MIIIGIALTVFFLSSDPSSLWNHPSDHHPARVVLDTTIASSRSAPLTARAPIRRNVAQHVVPSMRRIARLTDDTVHISHGLPDRLEPLTVYVLDSMELASIGVWVHPRGAIFVVDSFMCASVTRPEDCDTVTCLHQAAEDFFERTDYIFFHTAFHGTTTGKYFIEKHMALESVLYRMFHGPKCPSYIGITDSSGKTVDENSSLKPLRATTFPSFVGISAEQQTLSIRIQDTASIDVTALTYGLNLDRFGGIRDLVPIRISATPIVDCVRSESPYWIYWFERTSGFLDILPERVRDAMQRNSEERSSRLAAAVVKRANGKQPATTSLFPNPVRSSSLSVSCTFDESRTVGIGLYDIAGRKLKSVDESAHASAGTWTREYPLDDVPPGVYLLAIITDRGEQTVRQVMVER